MPRLATLYRRALEIYQSEGATATARATTRFLLRQMLDQVDGVSPSGKRTKKTLRAANLAPYLEIGQRHNGIYDVILVTDLRFIGGSGQSSAEEVEIQHKNGLKTGLYHLPTHLLNHRRILAPAMDRIIRSGMADLLNHSSGRLRTRLLLFRHPTILNPNGAPLPEISAEHVGLIVNHTPIKFGRIEYLLPLAGRRLREAYGCYPQIYPIGPLIRSAINETYDNTVSLADEDWVNVFDLARFDTERRPPQQGILRIGRHSRPNPEKWPNDPAEIREAYPDDQGIEVHILGGADVPERLLGGRPSNWIVHEYGSMDAAEFLRGIDVFVYFHHPDWVEAFGRVIVEAMAAGLPVVLPPHFRPLLGDAAMYCQASEVRAVLDRLRDPAFYQSRSEISRNVAQNRFGHVVHLSRLAKFGAYRSKRDEGSHVQAVNVEQL